MAWLRAGAQGCGWAGLGFGWVCLWGLGAAGGADLGFWGGMGVGWVCLEMRAWPFDWLGSLRVLRWGVENSRFAETVHFRADSCIGGWVGPSTRLGKAHSTRWARSGQATATRWRARMADIPGPPFFWPRLRTGVYPNGLRTEVQGKSGGKSKVAGIWRGGIRGGALVAGAPDALPRRGALPGAIENGEED
ncbi:MAG: hypothetical protein JWN40_970 [Phycisphaerales bacterium]|nr:hypothetical protein [Phycisphaerales bacterium]